MGKNMSRLPSMYVVAETQTGLLRMGAFFGALLPS